MKVLQFHDKTGLAKLWTEGVEVEDEALAQISRLASMPFTFKHVAVMPDCHVGIGATVGTVFASENVLIPAAVGVDLGCGMIAQRTNLSASDLPDDLYGIRAAIEKNVPHGRTDSGGANDLGAWGEAPDDVRRAWAGLEGGYQYLTGLDAKLGHRRPLEQLGTLGTGNHFIEICLDEEQRVWVMLHSGSRGPGNRIASTFIKKAKRDMERWHIQLPDRDLAYIPEGSAHFRDYVNAVNWAQKFAEVNREIMMRRTLVGFATALDRAIDVHEHAVNCHHNYVSQEQHFGKKVWVTRKGAVRAGAGELGIIPGSMGERSYIVRGLGNRESFMSCSHGAGRRGSRRWARETFTVEDHARATEGVECRKDESVLDETPAAYKDIDAVMEAQSALVEPVHTLKQILCVKG